MNETRDLERVVCWANRWGDLETHRDKVTPERVSRDWTRGYEQAIDDVMARLEPLAPNWLETWQREEWGFHNEAAHV